MKTNLSVSAITFFLVCWVGVTKAQSQSPSFTYKMYFSAIVVNNLDASVKWYKSVFDVTVKNRMGGSNQDYNITILESPELMLELLELKGSLPKKEMLKGKPDGTQIQGHFKIGFKVNDMDNCLKHLDNLNIKVPQIWGDVKTKTRNFLISDPDGNLIQFYE